MSGAGDAIRSKLVATSAVTTLVSTRVYVGLAAKDAALPHIVFTQVSGPRVDDLDGPEGLAHPRMQVTSWDDGFAGVQTLADLVRTTLDGSSGSWGGVTVADCILEDERHVLSAQPGAAAARKRGIQQDYIVWHTE